MSKKAEKAKLEVAKLLNSWQDPHSLETLPKLDTVQSVTFPQDHHVELVIRPTRPHCPCCLLNLQDLYHSLAKLKGIDAVRINIVGIPAHEKWTKLLNAN